MLTTLLFAVLSVYYAFAATLSVESYSPVPSTAAGPHVATLPACRLEDLWGGAYMVTDGLY